MNARRSKLARKAARVVKSQAHQEFDAELAIARRELNETKAHASALYRKGVAELEAERRKWLRKADEQFEETRDRLVAKYAKKEAEAVAA